MVRGGGSATTRRKTRRVIQKIPSIRSASRKNCPPGHVLRRSYTRHYSTAVRAKGFTVKRTNGKSYHVNPSNKNTHVEARCVKNTGGPRSKSSKLFGPLKKGELARYGYSFRASESQRHAALKKAVLEYTALGVYRKLDAVAKLTEHTAPKASKAFATDREWVRKSFGPLKAAV
jgi:hypothetical protein